MRQRACPRCGVGTVDLPCHDGRTRSFTTVELADPDIDENQRWYWLRGRGAVHGGLVVMPSELPYFTLHSCGRTRLGTGQSRVAEAGRLGVETEIALRDEEPRTEDSPLSIPGRVYSYRYVASWAHIVAGVEGRGLCGDRVNDPDAMTPRERERLVGMHVCPRCRARNTRDEAARRRDSPE